jgi:hypothetical protein
LFATAEFNRRLGIQQELPRLVGYFDQSSGFDGAYVLDPLVTDTWMLVLLTWSNTSGKLTGYGQVAGLPPQVDQRDKTTTFEEPFDPALMFLGTFSTTSASRFRGYLAHTALFDYALDVDAWNIIRVIALGENA